MNKRFYVSSILFLILASCSSKKIKVEEKDKKVVEKQESVVLVADLREAEIASDISGIKTILDGEAIKKFQAQKDLAQDQAPQGLVCSLNITSSKVEAPEVEDSQTCEKPLKVSKTKNRKIANHPSNSKQNEMYKVKAGDTLMKISYEKLGNIYRWREIYNNNKSKIPDYNRLITGTVLEIKGVQYVVLVKEGKPYLIKKADTLAKISKSLYGTPEGWKSLWQNNRQLIHDPNKIYAGFTLYYLDNLKKEKLDQPRGPANK